MLERDLADNRKHMRMLNSGSKDLDKILELIGFWLSSTSQGELGIGISRC